ncbi:MAG TPA: toll/interleukin-1 receptor domain-containing protein [Holophagaceae bacterium]|jgi:hypothetical protein|nr:toll/interleukin-1 receptor domain-containing protein [Holophagaceae bacterium]
MGTVDDYFATDQQHNIKVTSSSTLSTPDGVSIPFQLYQDFSAGAVYASFRLPEVNDPFQLTVNLLFGNGVQQAITSAPAFSMMVRTASETGPKISSSSLKFCGRVYIYASQDLTSDQLERLQVEAETRSLTVEYRGPKWAQARSEHESPVAFVSHDSRDKDEVARPLALELAKLGVPVWFDEFSLRLGDPLRESIEKGLRECKFCVLVVTPHFLANPGWTKTEFDAAFTREMFEKTKVILPVWKDVQAKEVYDYSQTLANKVAAKWDEGVRTVALKIAALVRHA